MTNLTSTQYIQQKRRNMIQFLTQLKKRQKKIATLTNRNDLSMCRYTGSKLYDTFLKNKIWIGKLMMPLQIPAA